MGQLLPAPAPRTPNHRPQPLLCKPWLVAEASLTSSLPKVFLAPWKPWSFPARPHHLPCTYDSSQSTPSAAAPTDTPTGGMGHTGTCRTRQPCPCHRHRRLPTSEGRAEVSKVRLELGQSVSMAKHKAPPQEAPVSAVLVRGRDETALAVLVELPGASLQGGESCSSAVTAQGADPDANSLGSGTSAKKGRTSAAGPGSGCGMPVWREHRACG